MIQAHDIQKVTLNDTEFFRSVNLGVLRELKAVGANPPWNKPNWADAILQASGQLALCKALNTYWPGDPDSFDLPGRGRVVVRVNPMSGGALHLFSNDPTDDTPIVLVVGSTREFSIVGWVKASEARKLTDASVSQQAQPSALTLDPKKSPEARAIFQPISTLLAVK